MERTLQLTSSSMSFHTSEGTTFNPAGAEAAGREFEEALNHTSSSFSGPTSSQFIANQVSPLRSKPSNALLESRSTATSRLIVKCGVPLKEDGDAV